MEVDKITNKDVDEGDDVLLPGFRFHPTDEELVGFYLRRKMENKPLRVEVIEVVDVYKFDPWDLPIPSAGDEEMYFFCLRERKYRNSIRPNRVTGSGFWKATGIDRRIYDSANDCIGLKKSLVYYRGSAGKGTKTDWMMHEFRLPAKGEGTNSTLHTPKDPILEAETWTLCRIFKRNASYRKYAPGWREPPSIKQRPSECSSPICSIEPVNGDRFIGSPVLRREGSMQLFDGTYETVKERAPVQLSSVTPTSSMQVYPNNINFRGNEVMRDGSWDELGTIIEFAYNPALLYGRKQ